MGDIRWDVLTIGHLSRNKFWGESDLEGRRAPLCTSTLIRTGELTLLVDPACPAEEMAALLDRRAGIRPEDVDIVFLTHVHGDHRVGVDAFPGARVCTGAEEKRIWHQQPPAAGAERDLLDRLEGVERNPAPGIELLATPGHTLGHTSLVVASEGRRVVVAGDAVMTRDFFFARDWYFNTVDPPRAVASIEAIARIADVIVPGHDNHFLVP